MPRPRKPPRIYKRPGRRVWYASLGRNQRNISMKTEDEREAQARLLELVRDPPPTKEDSAYRKLRQGPVVYFVQLGIGGPIKIGRTDNLRARLNTLQTANHKKVVVLGLLRGQEALERQMHALFHKERMDGEWFRPSMELLRFISSNTVRPR